MDLQPHALSLDTMVYISGFVKNPAIELPSFMQVKHDSGVYHGSAHSSPFKAPRNVEEALSNAKQHELFEFEGWMWHRMLSTFDMDYLYQRSKYISTSEVLGGILGTYLDGLEGALGKNRTVRELLPPFEYDGAYNFFRLPMESLILKFKREDNKVEMGGHFNVGAVLGFMPKQMLILSKMVPVASIYYHQV
jgi:hypothetical protein